MKSFDVLVVALAIFGQVSPSVTIKYDDVKDGDVEESSHELSDGGYSHDLYLGNCAELDNLSKVVDEKISMKPPYFIIGKLR